MGLHQIVIVAARSSQADSRPKGSKLFPGDATQLTK
jgi:hypothetical protein